MQKDFGGGELTKTPEKHKRLTDMAKDLKTPSGMFEVSASIHQPVRAEQQHSGMVRVWSVSQKSKHALPRKIWDALSNI